ncbi:putative membrane protein [Streptosporangium becharense]|uniref:Putative membrane protein n=1 Tax=Streptosporangium becharense TaxID=1816182 RepID=A0A7W9IBD9_9ACTN|nr:general stress protein [Streptosporangium becharense]MBB2915433.1 putative membrane protein [Streptosporangium becharense]MBB5817620.1 putative membrane protein [Streptosporangium becharense]
MRPDINLSAHEKVAGFGTYAEAQQAVDRLSDQRFPVEHAMIVGVDLRLVERVLGRLTYLRAAGMGAASGAWFGLLIGLFFGIFMPGRIFLTLALWGLLWGAVAGAVFGLIGHAMTGGKRDFLSSDSLVAGRYDLLVAIPHATEARRLLDVGLPQQMRQQI